LLALFADQVFGVTPKDKVKASYDLVSVNKQAFEGKATTKRIKATFSLGSRQHEMGILLYLPNQVKGKAPVFLVSSIEPKQIIYGIADAELNESLDLLLSAGYGLVTFSTNDVYPDGKGKLGESILPFFGYQSPADIKENSWQAFGAWAWGFSRVQDYLEKDKQVDDKRVVIMGHSRLGKTALWAGAQDKRFAMVISNESGCGGAALSKRTYGETIVNITTTFPYWFCPNFSKYANNEASLTFDQHELLALIAPRPLYVASAEGDRWADPKGEFLSAAFAGDVYKLYGMEGLNTTTMPALNQPIMNRIGYHIREGEHNVTLFDWTTYIAFADKWLK
jgi:hypothetical protein